MGGNISSLTSDQIIEIKESLNSKFEYCVALHMEKVSIVETIQIECKKLIEATGGNVDDEFMKALDDELKKRIETEPTLNQPKSRSRSNSVTNQVIKTPSEITQKSYERATKGSQRRRSYDAPPAAGVTAAVKRSSVSHTSSHGTGSSSHGSSALPAINVSPRRSSGTLSALCSPPSAFGSTVARPTQSTSTSRLPVLRSPADRAKPADPLLLSAPADPFSSPPPPLDSWDSVSQQPFCTLCQMAFKSANFLERHRKYSELHQINEASRASRQRAKDALQEQPSPTGGKLLLSPLTQPPHKLFAAEQQEGTHYKLLYCGSKLFWRTQKTLEFEFYHHLLSHTIEVVAFDYDKHSEVCRLYLDYSTVADAVQQAVQDAVDAERREIAMDRFSELPDTELLVEDSRRLAITSHILSRLQQEDSPASGSSELLGSSTSPNLKARSRVVFVALTNDLPPSPLLDRPPATLIPVAITRRRRSSAEEIDSTMRDLDRDRQLLVQATERAQKIAQLVYSSASAISASRWYEDLNPCRKRWIRAIRRVIRKQRKAEMVAFLQRTHPAMLLKTSKLRSSLMQKQAVSELLSQDF